MTEWQPQSKKILRQIALCVALVCGVPASGALAQENVVEISSVKELADYAARSGNAVRMKAGVYQMSDYLTDDVIEAVKKDVPPGPGRPPVWMINFRGSKNRFDLTGVVLEIETELYPRLPRGYVRCLFVSGNENTFTGLTVRNTGPNQGSNGNVMSVFGNGNTLENISLYVFGSKPYGYGDLLGKGGPNLIALQKQSGMMLAGNDNTARRCKVISRSFGHCFYIQKPAGLVSNNIRLEDCYAEGVMRPTSEMLRDTAGPAFDLNFRSVYENRDGRLMITPGYIKCLAEDGFRTYGGVGKVTLLNCTAVNTRAGFEIAGSDEGDVQTVIENGTALGCERGYLIGSNVTVRRSRGDIAHGPLLYLRGGRNSDVELELTGAGSDYTVHALATVAGADHKVRLFGREYDRRSPNVPIMFGFGMPAHAEMASPIRPGETRNVRLINEIPTVTVIRSATASPDSTVETKGPILSDDESKKLPERK